MGNTIVKVYVTCEGAKHHGVALARCGSQLLVNVRRHPAEGGSKLGWYAKYQCVVGDVAQLPEFQTAECPGTLFGEPVECKGLRNGTPVYPWKTTYCTACGFRHKAARDDAGRAVGLKPLRLGKAPILLPPSTEPKDQK